MRPVQDIRAAIDQAARNMPKGTYRDFCQAALVGYEAGRTTVKNMVKAGELVPVGQKPVGRGRPLSLYCHVAHAGGAAANDPTTGLAGFMKSWVANG